MIAAALAEGPARRPVGQYYLVTKFSTTALIVVLPTMLRADFRFG